MFLCSCVAGVDDPLWARCETVGRIHPHVQCRVRMYRCVQLVFVCFYVCMYVRMHIRMHECMFVCIYAKSCICVSTCACMHPEVLIVCLHWLEVRRYYSVDNRAVGAPLTSRVKLGTAQLFHSSMVLHAALTGGR